MVSANFTTNAFFGIVHEIRPVVLTFRIVAPQATQWTTLEENGGADARTVVDGEFLQGENQGLAHGIDFLHEIFLLRTT